MRKYCQSVRQCTIPARTPISIKTSVPHELIGPKARLWVSSPMRASSCSSEQDSLSCPSQSTALLQPPGSGTAWGGDTEEREEVAAATTDLMPLCLFVTAHLNSMALNKFISVVLAPHTMYPSDTRVLESSWLGLCLVEFNTEVNSAASWDGNRRYDPDLQQVYHSESSSSLKVSQVRLRLIKKIVKNTENFTGKKVPQLYIVSS